MSDPAAISNVLSYLPNRSQDQSIESDSAQLTQVLSPWRALWSVIAVHATELEREGVIDATGFATIARALDTVLLHRPATNAPLGALYTEMEQRIDALLPPEFAGVTTLGLAREDWQATAVRLLWVDAVELPSHSSDCVGNWCRSAKRTR